MARAPTRLKALFYGCETAEQIVQALAAAECLSIAARRNRHAVAQLIRTTLEPRQTAGPPEVGPSSADRLESALADAGYLSDRGLEWARTIVSP
jgi:hypothetical protein